MLQLDPPIPVYIPEMGCGLAHALIDYSCEFHVKWLVALDKDGQFWVLDNTKVRAQKNFSMGRTLESNDAVNKK